VAVRFGSLSDYTNGAKILTDVMHAYVTLVRPTTSTLAPDTKL